MGVYGVGTYGVAVYGPDASTPTAGGGSSPPPPVVTPLPPPDPGPDAGPGPRPPVNGGEVIAGAIPQFSVAPFTLNQIAYGQFFLEWTIPPHSSDPTADWRFFRLIRSNVGVPVSYLDGVALVDVDSWHSGVPTYNYDLELPTGKFYYYSIWLGQSAGNNETEAQAVWYNVGNVVGLAVSDYGWTQRLWEWIPRYYRYGATEVADADNLDQPLYKFVDVLGFHLDMINTDIDAAKDLYNPQVMQYGALERYGNSVGAALEPTVTARLNRERIGNAAFDQLLRGTAQGLENVLSALTGWDVAIDMGKNLLLNGDQSGPDHPGGHPWVYEYNYQAGELAEYLGYQYTAKVAHTGRIPPTAGGETDYWAPAVMWPTTLFLPQGTQMSQATWQMDGSAIDGAFSVVGGVQNVLTPAARTDSGWQVINNGGSPANAKVYFPGGTDFITPPTMNEVIKDSVPNPETLELTALTASLHVYWAPGDPTPTSTNVYLDFYDNLGVKLAHVAKPFWSPVYDSFSNVFDIPLTADITDTGNFWSVSSELWRVSGKYAYLNTQAAGNYFAYMNMLRPDVAIAVTMSRVSSARNNGLLLRWADTNNHIRISATGVQSVVSGVTNNVATFTSPFVDGDRMQATIIGSALTVKKNNGNTSNGWTASYTVNALLSNTYFGMWTSI